MGHVFRTFNDIMKFITNDLLSSNCKVEQNLKFAGMGCGLWNLPKGSLGYGCQYAAERTLYVMLYPDNKNMVQA